MTKTNGRVTLRRRTTFRIRRTSMTTLGKITTMRKISVTSRIGRTGIRRKRRRIILLLPAVLHNSFDKSCSLLEVLSTECSPPTAAHIPNIQVHRGKNFFYRREMLKSAT